MPIESTAIGQFNSNCSRRTCQFCCVQSAGSSVDCKVLAGVERKHLRHLSLTREAACH